MMPEGITSEIMRSPLYVGYWKGIGCDRFLPKNTWKFWNLKCMYTLCDFSQRINQCTLSTKSSDLQTLQSNNCFQESRPWVKNSQGWNQGNCIGNIFRKNPQSLFFLWILRHIMHVDSPISNNRSKQIACYHWLLVCLWNIGRRICPPKIRFNIHRQEISIVAEMCTYIL